MRSLLLLLVTLAVAGCGGDTRSPKSEALTPPQAAGGEVVYIDMEDSRKLLKRMPTEPDPAYGADDPISCKKAGGEWDDVYLFGTLGLREPREGAELDGKLCWSTRQPTRLADAGKPCSGQADCIGNCVAERRSDNHYYGPPRCQTNLEDIACGPIYDGGRYHWIECPIP